MFHNDLIEETLKLSKAYVRPADEGNLHIILGDGNLENSDIDFCREECIKYNDRDGLNILGKLVSMDEEERDEFWREWLKYTY